MPKKSHRVASRQAQVSKERKRKKRAQSPQRRATTAQVKPAGSPAAQPSTASKPAIQPSAATKPAAKPSAPQAIPRYRYVIADLRKIALIAGAMLIVLIVLAFVLG
jgi:hypothetical protein